MSALRHRRDGRKTTKKKPGPKQKNVVDSKDRDLFILLHALTRYPKLKTVFQGADETTPLGRKLAYLTVAIIQGDAIETRPGAVVCSEKLADAADALIKQYREITRDRARKDELASLNKWAQALFMAATPKRAALPDHPIVATPGGLFGAKAWTTKRVLKNAAAEHTKGEPPWIMAARLGALAAADYQTASRGVAESGFDDLKSIGFPVEKVFSRLGFTQTTETKSKSED
ncbi:MAG: hypothetical protein ACR652_10255 [Methylocystis sp.]|uniref:hypothetical protein n=1 Tax=Methylocystis sp. TaxID=1911079 RepID=UPI003DA376E3